MCIEMSTLPVEVWLITNSGNIDSLTSPFRGEWWELPPGVRSGDADLYKGYEESESSVLAAIATHKPNALLGQSQGAILLFSMLIRGVLKDYQGSIILNGIQYPKPFDVLIDELVAKGDKMFTGGRVLLVVGSNDNISPPAGAMRCLSVLKVLCDEVEVCEHEGGHSVPIHDENASRIMLQYCLR